MDRFSDLLDQRRATKAAIIKRLEKGPDTVHEIAREIGEDDLLAVVLACDDLMERGKVRIHRGRRRYAENDPRDMMGAMSLQAFRDDPDSGIRRLAADGLDREEMIKALRAIWGDCTLEKCVRSKTEKRRDTRDGRFLAPNRGTVSARRF